MPTDIELTCCQKFGDILYDVSAAVLSLVDVITDILVTIEFWQNERYAFFWVSIAIYFVAQCCYSGFFVLAFAENRTTRFQFTTLAVIFPVAQFIPLFIWMHSFNTPITKKCLKLFKLNTKPLDNDTECPADKDELQFWLERKFLSHGGFVIEAIIEAFPQSILQMIALVMKNESSPLNVCSIILSMTSVSSKCLIFSYSIHRLTFLFNFLCFTTDIFGIFTTLSWVFYNREFDGTITTMGWIWIYKVVGVSAAIVAAGILICFCIVLWTFVEVCAENNRNHRCGNLCLGCCSVGQCWGCVRECGILCGDLCPSPVECIRGLFCCSCQCVRNISTGCWKFWKWLFCRSVCNCCAKISCSCDCWKQKLRRMKEIIVGIVTGFCYLILLLLYVAGIPTAGVIAYAIAMMLLEIVKVSLLPFVFINIDDKHQTNVRFYRPIFNWMLSAQTKRDYHLRLAVANAYCCEDYLANSVDPAARMTVWQDNKFLKWILKTRQQYEEEKKRQKEEEEEEHKGNDGDDGDEEKYNRGDNNAVLLRVAATNDVLGPVAGLTVTTTGAGPIDDEKDENDEKDEEKQVIEEEEIKDDTDAEDDEIKIDAIAQLLAKTRAPPRHQQQSILNEPLLTPLSANYSRDRFNQSLQIYDTGCDIYLNLLADPHQLTMIDSTEIHTISDITNLIKYRQENQLTLISYQAESNFSFSASKPKKQQKDQKLYFRNTNMTMSVFNKFDYRHLLSIQPKHLRHASDWSFEYFLQTYFKIFKEFIDEEVVALWRDSSYFGRFFLLLLILVFFLAVYVVAPSVIAYILGSLLYPIICLSVTDWQDVDLLQFSLTCIYGSLLLLMIVLLAAVLRFQHANYHFIACRDGYWHAGSLDASFQIRKRYFDLISTKLRDQMIDVFFAELSDVMRAFLPELHEVDEGCVEIMQAMDVNVDYQLDIKARLFDIDI